MRRPLRVLLVLIALCFGACAPEGPSAFVTFNIRPDSSCVFSPDAEIFFGRGRYDIAEGGQGGGDLCGGRPYVMHLLVNSFLRPNANAMIGRAEPNVLQLHSAEVRLMDLNKKTLQFKGDKDGGELPNPFLVTTTNALFPASGTSPSIGVASVDAIPARYAPFLSKFAESQSQILAEVQIFATTTGDVDVDFKPFTYPIQICDGCLTKCATKDFKNDTKMRDDYIGDNCFDNSGNDDRICVDPDC